MKQKNVNIVLLVAWILVVCLAIASLHGCGARPTPQGQSTRPGSPSAGRVVWAALYPVVANLLREALEWGLGQVAPKVEPEPMPMESMPPPR